jgi:hypothetical protein
MRPDSTRKLFRLLVGVLERGLHDRVTAVWGRIGIAIDRGLVSGDDQEDSVLQLGAGVPLPRRIASRRVSDKFHNSSSGC